MEKVVEDLVKKACECNDACQALQYTQAACNAANALRVLRELSRETPAN